jgi:hypothetical protein
MMAVHTEMGFQLQQWNMVSLEELLSAATSSAHQFHRDEWSKISKMAS